MLSEASIRNCLLLTREFLTFSSRAPSQPGHRNTPHGGRPLESRASSKAFLPLHSTPELRGILQVQRVTPVAPSLRPDFLTPARLRCSGPRPRPARSSG